MADLRAGSFELMAANGLSVRRRCLFDDRGCLLGVLDTYLFVVASAAKQFSAARMRLDCFVSGPQ